MSGGGVTADHTCGQCCQSLSYVDSILRFEADGVDLPSRWWRVRHPWLWHAVKVRRGFATEILWESGK